MQNDTNVKYLHCLAFSYGSSGCATHGKCGELRDMVCLDVTVMCYINSPKGLNILSQDVHCLNILSFKIQNAVFERILCSFIDFYPSSAPCRTIIYFFWTRENSFCLVVLLSMGKLFF